MDDLILKIWLPNSSTLIGLYSFLIFYHLILGSWLPFQSCVRLSSSFSIEIQISDRFWIDSLAEVCDPLLLLSIKKNELNAHLHHQSCASIRWTFAINAYSICQSKWMGTYWAPHMPKMRWNWNYVIVICKTRNGWIKQMTSTATNETVQMKRKRRRKKKQRMKCASALWIKWNHQRIWSEKNCTNNKWKVTHKQSRAENVTISNWSRKVQLETKKIKILKNAKSTI